jgi:hypothetical protein
MPATFLPRIFSLPVPPKNINIKTYLTVCSPIIWYEHVIWSVIWRAEQRLREFEDKLLPKIFEPKWDSVIREWRNWFHEELHGLYFSRNGIRVLTLRERDKHVGLTGRAGIRKGFWGRNQKDIDRLEYLILDGGIILNLILSDSVGKPWTVLIWRSRGTSGGPLWTQ